VKKEGTNKTECWASTYSDVFKNPYTEACSGHQNFTGLTVPGLAQYNKHLEDVKNARKNPAKRQFERGFWVWFQGKSDIQCSMHK